MKILLINCHTDNRGDEAAVHALVDELNALYIDLQITIALRGSATPYPNMPSNVKMIQQFMPVSKKGNIAHAIAVATKGKVAVSSNEKILINEISGADLILHAPGGPSIGDIYYDDELTYLKIYDIIQAMGKPYMFYAPSMGPFDRAERNQWRRKVLSGAKAIVLRDPISAYYAREFMPESKIYQTLDSAFQHDIDLEENQIKLSEYKELNDFLNRHNKCIGITITDLLWHPVHSKDPIAIQNVRSSFSQFLKWQVACGCGIVLIPQLYGRGNDYNLMKSFAFNEEDFFVIPDNDERYDTYFQQYIIGQLYAVIGMRYHSNIFSAKMGTPFISVSYEQKMKGFMKKMMLDEYCIELQDLSFEKLLEKYKLLQENHDRYRRYLVEKHNTMKQESYRTTEIVNHILKKM